MKPFLPMLLLSAITSASTPAGAAIVENLRCEYKIAPQGLDVPNPRLSWQWNIEGAWKKQGAYQLLVASSPEKLAKGIGDLWDTQKVISDEPMAVYAGRALLTHQRCYWKVRVWETTGSSSPWSEIASWTMGLTNQKEWTAQWIGSDKAEAVGIDGKAPPLSVSVRDAQWICGPDGNSGTAPVGKRYFTREVEIPEGTKIKSAALHAAGDNLFTLAVNGKQVAQGEDWRHTIPADVTKLLVPGKNVLLGMVDNLAEKGPNTQGPMGLFVSLDIDIEGGKRITILSDKSWKTSREPKEDADKWTNSKELGKNGAEPWGKVRASGVAEYLPATYLRRAFKLEQTPVRAVVYATAHGAYELHLNGARVGDEYFAPGFTNYEKRALFRTYDVTKLLKTGDNALGAILGDGWFRGNLSILGQNRYGSKTRLYAQLHMFFANGDRGVLVTDGNWKAGFGPILESDMQAGETYDARREIKGWNEAGFDDSKWFKPETVVSFAETTKLIAAHAGPPVRAQEEIRPIAITEPKPGLFVFNMGQNFAGWARLKVQAKAGSVITMRFGEMLNVDGTVYRENLRSARAIDTYVCKGTGMETWEPHFTYHGFQYVEIEGFPQKPTLDAITGIVVHSENEQTGKFECSNPLFNKIWSNVLWGQKSNYFDIPTDCPQRDERLGWTGDTQVFVRTGAYNQDVNAFFTKWMDDLVDEQGADGDFPNMAPSLHGGWSPGWADAGIIVPWTMYQVYGDKRLLEKHYDAIEKHVLYYQSHAPNFIVPDAGFGDWLAIGSDTPKRLIYLAYFAHSAKLLSNISAVVDKKVNADKYQKVFEDVRREFQSKFVAPDGKIGTGSQTGYLMALRFDLLTPEQRTKAAELLVKDIEAQNGHLTTGFLGVNLLLPTLTDIGRTDVAYKMMSNTTFPSWGYSIEQGATTIWERWNSYTKDKGFGPVSMNSFNHYAYGSCGEWLYRTVLGIDTLEPGFKKIIIKPEPGPGLTWARGSYNSIRGPIRTSWKIADGAFQLDATIPANSTAEIYVPSPNAKAVTVNGRPAAQTRGLKLLREEKGFTVLSAEPGSYAFVVANYPAQ